MNDFFLLHPFNFRNYSGLQEEVLIAQQQLGDNRVGTDLLSVTEGSIIIPRYRVIPFGKEVEIEALNRGAKLINSYSEHLFVADQGSWWRELAEVGLTAWRHSVDEYPSLPEGEYFVKGQTNSLKNSWFEACYAPNKASLMDIVRYNMKDSVVGSQSITIQPFQKFRQIATAVDGRPVFNERRAFVYRGEVLSHAPYWSSFPEALNVQPADHSMFEKTLEKAVMMTADSIPFYVIDLAEMEDGSWKVVELNDGCMSGLSGNAPEKVFGAIYQKGVK